MGPFGDVLGLPFALEGLAFFAEAIFLGIYLYGWNRLPGGLHSLMLIPVMLAGVLGTFFVVSVNAWMNAPSGFRIVDGEVTDVEPLAAIRRRNVQTLNPELPASTPFRCRKPPFDIVFQRPFVQNPLGKGGNAVSQLGLLYGQRKIHGPAKIAFKGLPG